MSTNSSSRKTSFNPLKHMGFSFKKYSKLKQLGLYTAEDILAIPFDEISGNIMSTGDAMELFSNSAMEKRVAEDIKVGDKPKLTQTKADFAEAKEKIKALICLLEQRKKLRTGAGTPVLNLCYTQLSNDRDRKKDNAAAADRIVNMANDTLAYEALKGLSPAPDGEIIISRKGGRKTRTRKRTRKSHKRHKKRSTRRRR
jgi:hypothetical protein